MVLQYEVSSSSMMCTCSALIGLLSDTAVKPVAVSYTANSLDPGASQNVAIFFFT